MRFVFSELSALNYRFPCDFYVWHTHFHQILEIYKLLKVHFGGVKTQNGWLVMDHGCSE